MDDSRTRADDQRTTAVGYIRQSITSGEVDASLSLEFQERACREHAAAHGWSYLRTYCDPDTRGWKVNRAAFTEMLATLRSGAAGVVIVYKLSRFARNLMHQETVLTEVADAGGELVSVTEPYLTTSPMVRQILGAVNEQYKRDMGDFLRATYEARARRGLHHGYAPIGYRLDDDGRLVMDDAAAPVVRRIFAAALRGDGARGIALDLNAEGVLTQRGNPWTHATVLNVLRNPAYAGMVRHRGEIIVHDAHPAYITPDEHARVLAVLARRRGLRRKDAGTSWADGFVFHVCGRRMYLTAWRRTADGATRFRYRCNAQFDKRRGGDHACSIGAGSVFAERVEDGFAERLVTALLHLASPEDVQAHMEAAYAHTAAQRAAERHRLERRLADLSRQRDRLLDLALAGRVDDELYVARDAALKAGITAARAELDAVPPPVNPAAVVRRHTHLVPLAGAVIALVRHAPHELPPLLHDLDARCIVGPDGIDVRFGPDTAPYLRRR